MSQHRVHRVSDLLIRELNELLRREVRDPRMSMAQVTSIDLSRDLSHATVRVSYLGDEDARDECIAALEKARGFFRSKLAPRLQLRRVPELNFVPDRGAEHSQRIHDLLEELDP